MNKKKRIIFFVLLFVIALQFNIFTQLAHYGDRLDFFWNYNFGLQMANGLIPYNDFNLVITPLFPMLVSIFLKLFGKNVLIYIIFTSVLKIVTAALVAKLTLNLSNKDRTKDFKKFVIVFTFINILLYSHYFEYNYFAVLLILMIILLDQENQSKRKNFLLGILAGLVILSKQSVGFVLTIFVLLKPLLFKENKNNIIYRLIGIIPPILLFIINLILTDSFNNFISYAILGLLEFKSNKLMIWDALKYFLEDHYLLVFIVFSILTISVISYYIRDFYLIFIKKKKINNKHKIYLFYSISAFACFYPIMDLTHLLPSILPILALIFDYLFTEYEKIKVSKRLIKSISFICIVISIEIACYPLLKYINICLDNDKDKVILNSNYSNINGIAMETQEKKEIDTIIEYEKEQKKQGNEVIILDGQAIMFHLPQNKYYKDFDLFNIGNFGHNGIDRMIKEIDSRSDNTIYLINMYTIYVLENNKEYSQIPKEIIDYVKNKYNRIGTVGQYNIYKK